MNARFALALLVILPFAAPGCSEEEEPVVSGGAQFTLRNAAAADNPDMLSSCLDTSLGKQTVAQKDVDGNLKLVVNGADDAQVSCSFNASSFNVLVSRAAASFSASGPFVTGAECATAAERAFPDPKTRPTDFSLGCSTKASVFAATPANAWKVISKQCSIFFSVRGDKRLRGTVYCPLLESTKTLNACALTPESGDAQAFFSFANCAEG
jgi:hypothetical protein